MVDDALRRVGLTNAQYAVLAMLEDEGALSSAELARRCFVTPQTMNQIVASLQARALVGRAAHPHHGRILQTSLTEHERYDLVWLLRECARALAPTGGAGHASHQATPIPAGSPDTTQDRRSS